MFHIAQGSTSPQSNPGDWNDYLAATAPMAGFFVDVDTSNCGFTSTPHYLISIEGARGFHWMLSGLNCLYNVTANGFRVYLRWTDAPSDFNTIGSTTEPNPLRVQTAIDKGWRLKWTGIETCLCQDERNPKGEEKAEAKKQRKANPGA